MSDIDERLKKARKFALILCAVGLYLFIGTFIGI